MKLTLVTERLLLKTLSVEDVSPSYLDWLESKNAHFIINRQDSCEELRQYVAEKEKSKNIFLLGIFVKPGNVHIGNIKFEYLTDDFSIVEMGILIGDVRYRGKEIAKECIQAFSSFTKKEYKTRLMVLGVAKENHAAIKAYEKIGFRLENQEYSYVDPGSGMLMSLEL